jgi:hypothetical protein
VIALLVCCAALAFAVRAYNRAAAASASTVRHINAEYTKASLPAQPAPSSPGLSGEKLEVENIILTRFGFEPNEIVRPQGEFLLAVENRSGVGDVDLSLDTVAGVPVQRRYVPKHKLDWHEFFRLPPGEYVLTESGHPEWVCRITITAP